MSLRRLARIVRQRLLSILTPAALDRDLDQELAFHFEALVDEKIGEGFHPDHARREARRMLGNVASFRDACRDQRGVSWYHDMRADLRVGVRSLARTPVVSAGAILSLALGAAANAAVLGVMAAIHFDALRGADVQRVAVIRGGPAEALGISAADYRALERRSRSFERIEAALSVPRGLGDEGPEIPAERTTGRAVTSGFFDVLAVRPALGRVFTAEEARASANVVLLSHRTWMRRYDGDPAILGRRIPVDEQWQTVIGILPDEFSRRHPTIDIWTPMFIPVDVVPGMGRPFVAVGRLATGATIGDAQREMSAIAEQLARERPGTNDGRSLRVVSLRDELFGWTREPLGRLQFAVILVLLIASANVAGLLLVRSIGRRDELAVRTMLGAGAGRIARQLVAEGLLLAVAAAVLSVPLTWLSVRALGALVPPIGATPIDPVQIGTRIGGMLLALATVGAVAASLPSVIACSRRALTAIERPFRRVGGRVLRDVLVSVQIAIAFVVLIGFGLLLNSYVRMASREFNFDREGLLMFDARTHAPQRTIAHVGGSPYIEMLNAPAPTFSRILERLRGVAGIESVAGISFQPVDSLILPVVGVRADSDADAAGERGVYFLVTPGLFSTLRTPLIAGRDIAPFDTSDADWVAVVNQSAAARLWPGQDPIGRRIVLDVGPDERSRTVVGVVPDIPVRSAESEPRPVVYASYLQQPKRYRGTTGTMFGRMTFIVRPADSAGDLAPRVRAAVAAIEPRPISAITPVERPPVRIRYSLMLFASLAVSACLLIAIGIYCLTSFTVGARTREIGIRHALGASHRSLVAAIGRDVLMVALAGIVVGCLAARHLAASLTSQLWGVSPGDPLTYVVVGIVLFVVVIAASFVPLRRAVVINPSVALRSE